MAKRVLTITLQPDWRVAIRTAARTAFQGMATSS